MNANELGRKLGIGVRVAGRIAQQRAEAAARAQAASASGATPQGVVEPPSARPGASSSPRAFPNAQEIREIKAKTHRITRAAGRGVGGFLRPFGRVGGILWLEMTGFFFGLFALYFLQDLWRVRLSYAAGPDHRRFLIAAGLTLVFGYLSASAFWRARRR
jgi:hypothetical protein